ncbi:class I SAM-dependent methyltransferase [Paenibacillus abyssi]|uniref:Methyltransferase type 12 n=2 Tax=Paenibacillus abyssi TaxID=1340531 RepID=A0A917CL72_9BACL|nr:class I SAM-dependent methyltransferase [Paenibacillus abyssi]GGF92282.1 methyltransferase type 12 [Paenibacillus abyssi]
MFNCKICGSDRYDVKFSKVDKYSKESFDIVNCYACGFSLVYPEPLNQELINYYPSEYTPYNIKKNNIISWIKTVLIKREIKKIKKLFGGKKQISVLEVGCGNGEFLYHLKENTGWNVLGLEFNENAVNVARKNFGLDVRVSTLEESNISKESVDLVILRHVIEHIHDLKGFMDTLNSTLTKGGILYQLTPNQKSLDEKLFQKNWYSYDPPRHLSYFTEKSLIDLLNQYNHEIVDVGHSIDPTNWIYSLRDMTTNQKLKRLLNINPITLLIFTPINAVTRLFKSSGIIKVISRKR